LNTKKKQYTAKIVASGAIKSAKPETGGKFWNIFDKNNNLFHNLHFNKLTLLVLIHQIEEEEGFLPKRGRNPEYSLADSVILYFIVMTSLEPLVKIATLYKLSSSTLNGILNRVRPLLVSALPKLVSIPRPRYTEDTGPTGLIIDSTSVPVPRPFGKYEESKALYSVHHHTYAYNFECAQNPQTHVCTT
jgi:hypothetical protein